MEEPDPSNEALEGEGKELTAILRGKKVEQVWRHRPQEIGIKFGDGTRLFVDCSQGRLEVSVTGN